MDLANKFNFKNALPVWLYGEKKTKNLTMSSVAKVNKSESTLYVAGNSCYTILVNGRFVSFGPARAAHGYYKVDVIDLTSHLDRDENFVTIRTAGYNINSFAYLDTPPFVCAEIESDGKIIAFTDSTAKNSGFSHYRTTERLQKVQKYSFQRTFVENYKLTNSAFEYEYKNTDTEAAKTENTGSKNFICRDVPYGDYELLYPKMISSGTVTYSETGRDFDAGHRSAISSVQQAFYSDEIEEMSDVETSKPILSAPVEACGDASSIALLADTYVNLEFERDYPGIFSFEAECTEDTVIYFCFDEILNEAGQVDEFRMCCSNVIKWTLKPGKYNLVCAEPYVLKYLRIVNAGGSVNINDLKIHKIAYPMSEINCRYNGDDNTIQEIFDAAKETFAANAVDIYMDCASRERAGWLCDSFFTARVEKVLTGRSQVEKAFLTNFVLVDDFEFLPNGMLPMCYPSDHNDLTFIPNWAIWYVLELYEYLERTGDREFIDANRNRVYKLLDYFKQFENEYGLLENLESWVFIEWSKANSLTQDVNFPSNMLYAAMKSVIHLLYGDEKLYNEARALRKTIREMSLTESGFYCDNAVRTDGELVLSGECTEACQYYAFYFNIANEKDDARLLNTLLEDFGYERRKNNKYPEIHFANSFIGNYLRLDYICILGKYDLLIDNIKSYFYYMAKTTGTLWENATTRASCNHGFASHVIYWLEKAGLLN